MNRRFMVAVVVEHSQLGGLTVPFFADTAARAELLMHLLRAGNSTAPLRGENGFSGTDVVKLIQVLPPTVIE